MKVIEMIEVDLIMFGVWFVMIYDCVLKVLFGGCSCNVILCKLYFFYVVSVSGFFVIDVEGVEWVDFVNNMILQIYGYVDFWIMVVVMVQIGKGIVFVFGIEIEVDYVEYLVLCVLSFEKLCFVNFGIEVIMVCLKVVCVFMGCVKIVKVEGVYYGFYDYVEVSQMVIFVNWGEID